MWAPRSRSAAVVLEAGTSQRSGQSPEETSKRRVFPLESERNGYFSGVVGECAPGNLYRIDLDHGAFPDPASRFQPSGPHGPSQVVDSKFDWTDHGWRGHAAADLVIYELHLGTFTPEGTWRAAMERLPDLAGMGITLIEVMPVAEFPGAFGWGYDGVDLFAPTRLYGTPEEARRFVDRAHQLGVMVILDVVYNHVGPDGNFLREFSPDYFSARYANEWGDPLNFDGENSGPVREYFVTNARYWISEFHFDGLRLDATQQIFDASPRHILAEISEAVRREAGARSTFLVGENECQHALLVRGQERGGYGLDALWNDDFHHAARVAATGKSEAYFGGYRGVAQEFVSAAKYGFLYQGSWYAWQKQRRGRPAFDLQPQQFVHFLQNHDQIANTLYGAPVHQLTSPGRFRALTALLLLSPQIPLLFQGQEFGSSKPFNYFADHHAELRKQVTQGRKRFLEQFPSLRHPASQEALADPGERETFLRWKLDWSEREKNLPLYQLHQDLLRLRREDPTVHRPARVDGAVLADQAFVLRLFSESGDDRLLIVNLGRDLALEPAPEPLLAPLENRSWRTLWSSETVKYGGNGITPLETKANWRIPGESASLLCPDENRELPDISLGEKN